MGRANDRQPGGDHYSRFGKLQPWDVISHFNLDWFSGNVVKYMLRWKHKNGIEDLRKAQHYLEKLLELEDLDRIAEDEPSQLEKVRDSTCGRIGEEEAGTTFGAAVVQPPDFMVGGMGPPKPEGVGDSWVWDEGLPGWVKPAEEAEK